MARLLYEGLESQVGGPRHHARPVVGADLGFVGFHNAVHGGRIDIALGDQQALQRTHPGQNVGLYVWAEWCPICKTIQGTVDGVNADHPVITVAMQSGPPDRVARYLHGRSLGWHTLVDARSQLSQALGFGAVPAFAVITPQGQLRWPTVGLSSGWGLRLRLWLAR